MNAAQAATSGAAIPENPAPAEVQSLGMSDYFQQILPHTPVICGVPLKPLSIGHYRRMKRQNIAFVQDEIRTFPPHELVGDLLKAVLICSMRPRDYDAFIAQPDAEAQIRKWAQRQGFLPPRYLTWPIVGGWINRLVGPEVTQMRAEREAAYLVSQVHAFQEYIKASQSVPAHWEEETDSRPSAAHWSHSIESVLREKQHWTKEEIDEEPLTKALWDYFKSMETAGLVRLIGPEEQAELERQLTPEEIEESRVAMEKLWRHKFGDTPMPTAANPNVILPN